MAKQLTTEDKDALALKEAFAEKQYTEGVLAGTGLDMGSSVIDYLGQISETNLASELASRRLARAKQLSDAAGSGAAERLAGAEGRKTAVARDAAMKAATQAAQDPTGAAAVELAQKLPGVIQEAADTSKEQTAEQAQALKQEAFAEGLRSKAEDEKLAADQGKERARFAFGKKIFESLATLPAALMPQTYEARQASIAERQAQRQEGMTKGKKFLGMKTSRGFEGDKKAYEDIMASVGGDESKLSDRQQSRLQNIAKRQEKRVGRFEKSLAKQSQAESNLAAVEQAEEAKLKQQLGSLAELQKKYGNVLAAPVTPEKPA